MKQIDGNHRLQVGVLVDAARQPRWVLRILETVAALPECELAFVSVGGPEAPTRSLVARLAGDPGAALFTLFSALDDRTYARAGDALQPGDVRATVGPSVPAAPGEGKPLDVVLQLGRTAPSPSLSARARLGVWTLHFGAWSAGDPSLAGLHEVLTGRSVTVTELRASSPGAPPRVCARSVARTDVRSVRRSRGVFLAKSAALVARALREAHDVGAPAPLDAPVPSPAVALPGEAPRNAEMARMLVDHGLRYVRERVERPLYVDQWVMAWQRSEEFPSAAPFHYLLPPKDRFWADPFPVVRDGRRYIFFEEMLFGSPRGHIAVLELGDDGTARDVRPVLVRPYHLSYPFSFRHEGEDFMIPEGSAGGGVEVYRARRFPDDWELVTVMLPGVQAADVTLRRVGDRWWLFADVAVDGTRLHNEEFHLFHGPTPFGPWTAHRRNPISSDAGRARSAGAIIEHRGALYRPAQDSSPRYGYAVSFNEIVKLDPDDYAEVERGRMLPTWDPRLLATHTVNRDGDLTVIDAVMRRSR